MSTSRTPEAWIRELDHPVPEERRRAADALVAFGAAAEPALTASLGHRDFKVRRRVLLILNEIRAPKAIPDLMEYVLERPADSPDDTRSLAMRAILGALKPKHRKHCFDVFVQLRRDDDPSVRSAALEGLAKLGDRRGRGFLQESSEHDDEATVRDTARRMLATFQSVDVGDEVYSTQDLVVKLASTDAFQREMGIDELVKSDADAYEIFLEATRSIHPLARKSGLLGLGRLGDPRAFRLLLQVGDHSGTNSDERALAFRSLAQLETPDGIDTDQVLRLLKRHLGAEDVFVGAAALAAIGRLRHPDALDLVVARLGDASGWYRESAARALSLTAGPGDTYLLRALGDALVASGRRGQEVHKKTGKWSPEEVSFQGLALQAMLQIVEPGGARDVSLVPQFVRFIAAPQAEVRELAWTLLGRVVAREGDLQEEALRIVLEQTTGVDAESRRAAFAVLETTLPSGSLWALPRLMTLAQRGDTPTATAVIPLLARIGGPEAEQALGRLTRDERGEIADRARRALQS